MKQKLSEDGILLPIQIKFVDLWSTFDYTNNYILNWLRQKWDVEESESPDFLFAGMGYGTYKFRDYSCVRIGFTGENVRPDHENYDYTFTYDHKKIVSPAYPYTLVPYGTLPADGRPIKIDNSKLIFLEPSADYADRHFRWPCYYLETNLLENPKSLKPKTKFCAFMISNCFFCTYRGNGDTRYRMEFFEKLSQYKKVDSGGGYKNNIGRSILQGSDPWSTISGYWNSYKIEFLRPYKFSIAFDNTSYPGYNTEKLFEAMLANTIPIYWGDPLIKLDYNTKSFINVMDFQTDAEAIEYIIKVDNDKDLYQSIYEQPYLLENRMLYEDKIEKLYSQFRKIFQRDSIIKRSVL